MHIALFLTLLYSSIAYVSSLGSTGTVGSVGSVGSYGSNISHCGDGICDTNETCTSCPYDCSKTCVSNIVPLAYCYGCQSISDAYCYVYEIGSCSAPPPMEQCGDGVCNGNEDCYTCNLDCGSCAISAPIWEYCGDFVCNNGETCQTCPNDCGQCDSASPSASPVEMVGNDTLFADDSYLASNNANTENMPMLIGSISTGLLLMAMLGVGVGVVMYRANKRARLAKEKQEQKEQKEQEQVQVEKTDIKSYQNAMINPILKTHSIQRNPVTSTNLSPSVRVTNGLTYKKTFAPQRASPVAGSGSITSDAMKRSQAAFLEQYDLSSFNAIHARQHVRRVRQPTSSSGARIAEQINKLSV